MLLEYAGHRDMKSWLDDVRNDLDVPRHLRGTKEGERLRCVGKPRLLLCGYDASSVVVYVELDNAEVAYVKRHGHLSERHLSRERTIWLRPQFVSSMYHAQRGEGTGQKRVVALKIARGLWDDLLRRGVCTTYQSDLHGDDEAAWRTRRSCKNAPVIVQWDPMHMPFSRSVEWFRVLHLGLRGSAKAALGTRAVLDFEDVMDDVDHAKQRHQAFLDGRDKRELDFCVPREEPFPLSEEMRHHLGVSEVWRDSEDYQTPYGGF